MSKNLLCPKCHNDRFRANAIPDNATKTTGVLWWEKSTPHPHAGWVEMTCGACRHQFLYRLDRGKLELEKWKDTQ